MAKKQALCWFIAKTSYICRMYMQKMKSLFTYIRFWFYITLEKLGLRRSSPSSRSKGKGDCQ